MLQGSRIALRLVRESDLDELHAAHTDIANRGAFFPLGVISEPRFAETGYWQPDEGTLLIVGEDDGVAGHIEFFKPVSYWDALELSYQLYDERSSGRGYVTEAVQLLVDYLFATKKQHRIHLVIVPENAASRRIAEKCGFVLEGTVRGTDHEVELVFVIGKTASRVKKENALSYVAGYCLGLDVTVRGAFFNAGRNHDVLLYSLLRTDPRPWQRAG